MFDLYHRTPTSLLSFAKLQEDGIELASLIKASNMYRRGKSRNIVTDYVPPTEEEKEEFRKAHLEYVCISLIPSVVAEIKILKILLHQWGSSSISASTILGLRSGLSETLKTASPE